MLPEIIEILVALLEEVGLPKTLLFLRRYAVGTQYRRQLDFLGTMTLCK